MFLWKTCILYSRKGSINNKIAKYHIYARDTSVPHPQSTCFITINRDSLEYAFEIKASSHSDHRSQAAACNLHFCSQSTRRNCKSDHSVKVVWKHESSSTVDDVISQIFSHSDNTYVAQCTWLVVYCLQPDIR